MLAPALAGVGAFHFGKPVASQISHLSARALLKGPGSSDPFRAQDVHFRATKLVLEFCHSDLNAELSQLFHRFLNVFVRQLMAAQKGR